MQNNPKDPKLIAQQHIAENLSRVTTHDTPLTTANQEPIVTDFTKRPSGNLQGDVPTYASDIGTGNIVGGHFPITKENEFLGRNVAGETSMPLESGLSAGRPLNTNVSGGQQFVGTTTGMTGGMPYSGGFAQGTNLTTEMPIVGGTQTGVETGTREGEVHEGEHKKGFFSRLFHHEKKKNEQEDMVPGSQEFIDQPAGLLDEKGTTVTLPEGTASNSKLGLPVTGPDYTHGTHGITENTVFTGGFHSPSGGIGQNVATTSMPLGLGTQSMTGFQPGVSGFQPGVSGYREGEAIGTGFGENVRGIDVSGANATHVERDITLQEGGLLGLRQGAVTGNPGDIITNYIDTNLQPQMTKPIIQQPVVVTQTITQPVMTESQEIKVTHIPPTGLGHKDCSLLKPHQ